MPLRTKLEMITEEGKMNRVCCSSFMELLLNQFDCYGQCIFLNFIGVELIYDVESASGVQQSESLVQIYASTFLDSFRI